MHEAGMAHGDAKWANVMLREVDGDLAFIDLDSLSRTRRGWCLEHARDIARFLLDCEEAGCPPVDTHSRFLEDYAEARQLRVKNMDVAVIKVLNRMRLKHEKRYGSGHRLKPKTTT
jgi:tRNA A-37 threonylcarbamoyl transferase component Bud32